MNSVTKYQGVKIYLQETTGQFYCDCVNNSGEYSKKTFNSTVLAKIKKAIDTFEGSRLGTTYYYLQSYPIEIKEVTAISKVGDRIIFDKEGLFNFWGMSKKLYPPEFKDDPMYKKILALSNLDKVRLEKVRELEKVRLENSRTFKNLVSKIKVNRE